MSNDHFAVKAQAEGWRGNGTQANPYIIQGLDINASGGYSCISISQTTVYFHVRNCYLHDAMDSSGPAEAGGRGLELIDVQHGVVENCNVERCYHYGLTAQESEDVSMRNNTCRLSMIIGIYFATCWSATFPDLKSSMINNTCENGTGYGLSIYDSSNVTVSGNTIRYFAKQGIVAGWSRDGAFCNNTISNCGTGINMSQSDRRHLIADNMVANCTTGIHLKYSSNYLLVVRNRIENCSGYGIMVSLAGPNNRIWHNRFVLNHNGGSQAYDSYEYNGEHNFWNSAEGGNWWSDWTGPDEDHNGIVDLPYLLDGGKGVKDFLPLATSVTQVDFEVNLVSGWNLVSSPLLANYTAHTVPGLSSGDLVVKWDLNQYWVCIWDLPLNNFDILPSTGYWIWTATSKTMELYGTVPAEQQSRTITIPTGGGWTLVGFSSLNESRHASDVPAMYSVAGGVKVVVSWNSTTRSYNSWISEVPSMNDFLLVPGQGYFVYCSASGILVYNP